jgi:hypothetical protein
LCNSWTEKGTVFMIKLFLKFRLNYLISLLLILGFLTCSEEKNQEDLIAVVEDEEILIDDFRIFYEFDSNFGIDSTGMDALKDVLDKFIDHYLARMKAEDEDLWDEPDFLRGYNWEKRQAMLRQLYFEVVGKSVEVTDEETLQEFMNLSVDVNIRHLFTKTEARIEELYRRLQAGESFEDLASEVFQDTVLSKNGGNLGWIKLVEFEGNLIEAIEHLKIGEISKPISSERGFHIIEVLNRKEQTIIVEEDYFRLKEKLYKRIAEKKSRKLSNEFVLDYIGQFNPQLTKLPFRQLLHVLVPPAEREKKEYTNKITLSDAMILAAEEDLSELADQDLIVYKDGSVSIREYLTALKEIPLGHRPKFNSAQQLSNQINVWERDNLLLKRAVDLDLDENEQVQKELHTFKSEQSYYYYLNGIRETMLIPHFVFNYFQISEESRFKAPDHPLAGFFNLETWRWWRAEINLRLELRRKNPSIWINQKLLEQEEKQVKWIPPYHVGIISQYMTTE